MSGTGTRDVARWLHPRAGELIASNASGERVIDRIYRVGIERDATCGFEFNLGVMRWA